MRKLGTVLLTAALALLAHAPLSRAHEFWMEPQQFRAAAGAKVPVRLFVGQYFKGNSIPWLGDNYQSFYFADAKGTEKIRGVLGDDPAATIAPRAPGRVTVVLRSGSYELLYEKPGEFEAFLAKDGIDHLMPRGFQAKLPLKETYSRNAKSLLISGTAQAGSPPDRAYGLTLELVAESDPYAGKTGPFTVKALYNGSPLPNALVIGFHKAAPDHRIEGRTDAAGRARLTLDRKGVWLLNVVHLLPASKKSGAQWETLWSSLTFEIP